MTSEMLRYIIAGFLVLHGIGHSGAYWFFAKSWLSPALAQMPARWIFVGVWSIAMVAYLAAGILLFQQNAAWRILAIAASIVSLIAAIPFLVSPSLNAAVADVVILAALLYFGWPGIDIVGA